MKIIVNSEIGKLKKVLLHRPGVEVERIYPEIFEHILFDDMMYTKNAQKEHDFFVAKLKENGVEVLYIENLVAAIFDNDTQLRKQFLKQFISEANVKCQVAYDAIYDFLDKEKNNLEFVKKLIAGVQKSDISCACEQTMDCYITKNDGYPFYIEPLPNLLFQRDAIASVYNGMNVHNMTKPIRKREGIFCEYLLKYHPDWQKIKSHLTRRHEGNVEGGDILVMSDETIFVGISERTNTKGVEVLALELFSNYPKLKNIIGIHMPKKRSMMHLDTIITQMDYDKFSIDGSLLKSDYLVSIIRFGDNELKVINKQMMIKDVLKEYIHPDPKLFAAGGNDVVAAKAEQWNDGTNCLTLEPGVIFVYDRNTKTNKALQKAGVKLIEIPSGELSRGRGGPRCMSMPLERAALKI